MLNNVKPVFPRPSKDSIHVALRDSLQKSYLSKLAELINLHALEPQSRKPYIRSILYPARLIYSWDFLAVNSNDCAVEYLQKCKPAGLDLKPIEMALACRHERCAAEDVFALKTDLHRQFASVIGYIKSRP